MATQLVFARILSFREGYADGDICASPSEVAVALSASVWGWIEVDESINCLFCFLLLRKATVWTRWMDPTCFILSPTGRRRGLFPARGNFEWGCGEHLRTGVSVKRSLYFPFSGKNAQECNYWATGWLHSLFLFSEESASLFSRDLTLIFYITTHSVWMN